MVIDVEFESFSRSCRSARPSERRTRWFRSASPPANFSHAAGVMTASINGRKCMTRSRFGLPLKRGGIRWLML